MRTVTLLVSCLLTLPSLATSLDAFSEQQSNTPLLPSVIARRNAYAVFSSNCANLKAILTPDSYDRLGGDINYPCSGLSAGHRPIFYRSVSCTLSSVAEALSYSFHVKKGQERAAAVLLKEITEAKVGLPACNEVQGTWLEPAARPAPTNLKLREDVPPAHWIPERLMDIYDQASTPTVKDFEKGNSTSGRCYFYGGDDKPHPFALAGNGIVNLDNGPLLPRTYLEALVSMERLGWGGFPPDFFDRSSISESSTFSQAVYVRPITQDGSWGARNIRIKKMGSHFVVKVLNTDSCAGGYSKDADPDTCMIERMCYTFLKLNKGDQEP